VSTLRDGASGAAGVTMGEIGRARGLSSTWGETRGVGGRGAHGGTTGEAVTSGVVTSTLRDVAGAGLAGLGWWCHEG